MLEDPLCRNQSLNSAASVSIDTYSSLGAAGRWDDVDLRELLDRADRRLAAGHFETIEPQALCDRFGADTSVTVVNQDAAITTLAVAVTYDTGVVLLDPHPYAVVLGDAQAALVSLGDDFGRELGDE